MNADLLKGKLRIKGYSIPDIVQKLNDEGLAITKSAFYRKLRGETQFTAKEITAITKIADFSKEEMYAIFFKELVS